MTFRQFRYKVQKHNLGRRSAPVEYFCSRDAIPRARQILKQLLAGKTDLHD